MAAFFAVMARGSVVAALFILIGTFVAVSGARQILAAIGPRPHVWMDRTKVETGETFKFRWETSGRFGVPTSIRVTWEGRETAVERGYDATFHRSCFVARVVSSEIGPLVGTASIAVPPDAMPSFSAKNALIEWRLRAEVQTRKWPNVREDYLIIVLPSRVDPR